LVAKASLGRRGNTALPGAESEPESKLIQALKCEDVGQRGGKAGLVPGGLIPKIAGAGRRRANRRLFIMPKPLRGNWLAPKMAGRQGNQAGGAFIIASY